MPNKPTKKSAKAKKFDMIAIGDCTMDAFVIVDEASVHCNIHHEDCLLCFSFANKVPYRELQLLSAGNANNVAVGSSRLGFKSAFYGTVGTDQGGTTILQKLKSEKVDTRFMHIQKNKPTNFHFVLSFQGERTILIKHQDFDYKLPAGISDTKWVYLTSVGKKGLTLHKPLAEMLNKNPDIKMSFNPGTFQLRMGLKKLLPLFKRTEILFVNKEEAELLVGKATDMKALLERLQKTGPKNVVITDGLKGSYVLDAGVMYNIGVFPHHPIEATGAGDAYATAFTAAIMYNLPPSEALRWGARNGASVATKVGPQAGLVTKKEMLSSLAKHKKFQPKIVK